MATKQLPDLAQKDTIGKYDFVLMRDTTTSTDKKITSKDFVESTGNPSVQGFSALMQQVTIDDTTINSITLTPSNNSTIYGYSDGMRISFRADIASADENELRIGDLDYVRIYDYGTVNDITYSQYDFVEAVYVTDHFERINNFKAGSFVYSNDYVVILVDEKVSYTDVYLKSAYGATKTEYYDGMVVNFLSTFDSERIYQGDGVDRRKNYLVRVSIDGLPFKDVVIDTEATIFNLKLTTLYQGQVIKLYYDGIAFTRVLSDDSEPRVEEELVIEDMVEESVEDEANNLMPVLIPRIQQSVVSDYSFVVGDDDGSGDLFFATIVDCTEYIKNQKYPAYTRIAIKINKILDDVYKDYLSDNGLNVASIELIPLLNNTITRKVKVLRQRDNYNVYYSSPFITLSNVNLIIPEGTIIKILLHEDSYGEMNRCLIGGVFSFTVFNSDKESFTATRRDVVFKNITLESDPMFTTNNIYFANVYTINDGISLYFDNVVDSIRCVQKIKRTPFKGYANNPSWLRLGSYTLCLIDVKQSTITGFIKEHANEIGNFFDGVKSFIAITPDYSTIQNKYVYMNYGIKIAITDSTITEVNAYGIYLVRLGQTQPPAYFKGLEVRILNSTVSTNATKQFLQSSTSQNTVIDDDSIIQTYA